MISGQLSLNYVTGDFGVNFALDLLDDRLLNFFPAHKHFAIMRLPALDTNMPRKNDRARFSPANLGEGPLRYIRFLIFTCLIVSLSSGETSDAQLQHPAIQPRNVVALTFDDGPSAQYTPQILDALKEHGVHATFFVIGRNVIKHPGIVKREVDEGHVVGNHTWSHPLMAPLENRKQLMIEICRTDSAVYSAAGVHTTLFRPPHGWRSPWMVKDVENMGYDVINWTVDPKDWKHPKANIIIKRVDHALGKSAIVLLHDGLELKADPGQENTVQALREIIEDFKAKDYEFLTISQLINDPEFAKEYRSIFKVISEPKGTYR
jgi:peptidoglycan/xylan/chitin deacetylase (PgdA/CDA1 family)